MHASGKVVANFSETALETDGPRAACGGASSVPMFTNMAEISAPAPAEEAAPTPTLAPSAAQTPPAARTSSTDSVKMLKPDGTQLQFSHPDGFVPVGVKPNVRVIRGPDEITPEWLTPIYQSRGFLQMGGKVTSVQIKPLGDGLGVMGDLCLVFAEFEGGNDTTPKGFVAKFCPQKLYGFPKPVAETMAKGMFGTEAHWYNDFIEEEIGLPKPQAYFVGAKLKHRRPWRRSPVFCMLIELMPKPIYSLAGGCDHLPHLMQLMDGLATFHALWWEAPKKPPIEYIPSPRDMCGIAVPAIGFVSSSSFSALASCFGDTYAPILSWRNQLRGKHKALVRMMFEAPLTLTHGDVHLDNIFFDESWANKTTGAGGFKLIDFGNMQFLQGMFDVASLVGTCIEPDARRAMEKSLIERYHAKLTEGISAAQAAAYPLERCWRDYRLNLWRMVINVAFVCKTQFLKSSKAKTGMFSEAPSESDMKLKATYDARNRRLVAALVDNEFQTIIESAAKGSCCC